MTRSNPDITATNLYLEGVHGTLGTVQRPMVLDISGKVELWMRATLDPVYFPSTPGDIRDESFIRYSATETLAITGGVQVTDVETLLDISPAIFTEVLPFVATEDPVLLPRDQWFENGYTDEDDDEYFRRLEESGDGQVPKNNGSVL